MLFFFTFTNLVQHPLLSCLQSIKNTKLPVKAEEHDTNMMILYTDKNFVWRGEFPLCYSPGGSEKLLAGSLCGWGIVATSHCREELKEVGWWPRQQNGAFCLAHNVSERISRQAIFSSCHFLWRKRPPLIHLPSIPLFQVFISISPEKWAPLVLSERMSPSKHISKECCETLYCQCVVGWQPDLVNYST